MFGVELDIDYHPSDLLDRPLSGVKSDNCAPLSLESNLLRAEASAKSLGYIVFETLNEPTLRT